MLAPIDGFNWQNLQQHCYLTKVSVYSVDHWLSFLIKLFRDYVEKIIIQ